MQIIMEFLLGAPQLQFKDELNEFKKEVRQEVLELSKVQFIKQLPAFVFDWSVIVASAVICQSNFNLGLYFVALWLIAGRQHALLALMHEAAHFRVSKNHRFNDLVGNYLAAFPILAATEWYRAHHGQHHKYLNSDKDPDWNRKIILEEWQFPQPKKRFAKTLAKQFLYGGIEWIYLMIMMSGLFPLKKLRQEPKRLLTLLHKVAYYSVVFAAVTYFGLWNEFLLYWLAPLMLVFPLLQRMRSISEHFGLSLNHELDSSRNILSPWYEKAFFGPHHLNLHLIHHIFASVPQYNLPKLQKVLMKHPHYKTSAHQNDSYILPTQNSLLKDLVFNNRVKEGA